MGIIIRQSIKQSIVSYVAVFVAALAQLFIYPLDDLVTYGRAQKMIAFVFLFYPIMSFGLPQTMIKFFAKFGNKNKGYLLNFILITLASFLAFGAVFFVFREFVLDGVSLLKFDITFFIAHWKPILATILVLMLFRLMTSQMANYRRIVWPAIFDTLWSKLAMAVVVFISIKNYVPHDWLNWNIFLFYFIGLIAIVVYAIYLGRFDLKLNNQLFQKSNLVDIGRYSGYTGLAVLGANFAFRIDTFMAAGYVGDQLMGIYAWFIFLCGIIDIPARAVTGIASPVLSEAFENNDLAEVKSVYTKTIITMFIVCTAIYCLIFLSLADLIEAIGKTELLASFIIIFVIIGAVRVLQATLAATNVIITYSKYYRILLFITILLGVMNVTLNYYFITDLFVDNKLIGLCCATAISISIFYFISVAYVYSKFKLHPFKIELIYTLFAAMIGFGLAYFIPLPNNSIIRIILQSILFSIPYIYLVYKWKISTDINSVIDIVIRRIKNKDFKNII